MPRIDLDAARAARREAKREPIVVVLGGEEFELPNELSLDLAALITAGDLMGAVVALVGEDHADRFNACRPSMEDVVELFTELGPAYGLTVGESVASDGSSKNGSSRSRPTSSASTGSTSAKRAGGKSR